MNLTRRHMLGLSAAFAARPVHADSPPIVFAAASLKRALDQISSTVHPMRLSYGGSGALARQIMQGAPADVFLSAHPIWMDAVSATGLVQGEIVDLLGNQLVLIGSVGQMPVDLAGWRPDGRIAMGFVNAVPAGQYGKAAFESLGLWAGIEDQIVEVENVRAALTLVARGELPYGVVYASDAQAQDGVAILARFPQDTHPKIIYPIAQLTDAGAGAFAALGSSEAGQIFALTGFEVL